MKSIQRFLILLASFLSLSSCEPSSDANSTYSLKYEIVWKDYNGIELESEMYAYGETPTYKGTTPTRDSDSQYSYKFDKWVPQITTVTRSQVYVATYAKTTQTHTITWKNYDGTILNVEQYDYGETPAYKGVIPGKTSADPSKKYEFLGWQPAISAVHGDTTYTAYFSEKKATYNIYFDAGDGYFDDDPSKHTKTITCEYGNKPEFSEVPTGFSRQYAESTFTGWDKEFSIVRSDQTYHAEYSFSKPNTFCFEYQYVEGKTKGATLCFSYTTRNGKSPKCEVDWGDGSTKDSSSGSHTYSTFGISSKTFYIRVFASYSLNNEGILSFAKVDVYGGTYVYYVNYGIKQIDTYTTLGNFCSKQTGNSFFDLDPDLEFVNFHEKIAVINTDSFYSSPNLKKVTFKEVGTIEEKSFYNCEKLETVLIGDGDWTCGVSDKVFYNCKSLRNLNWAIGNVGDSAFYNCSSLTKLFLSSYKIDSYAFYNCISLAELEYKSGIDNSILAIIDSYAFYNCAFVSIHIPKSMESIGKRAFGNCARLSHAYYHGSQSDFSNLTINSDAFFGTQVTNIEYA